MSGPEASSILLCGQPYFHGLPHDFQGALFFAVTRKFYVYGALEILSVEEIAPYSFFNLFGGSIKRKVETPPLAQPGRYFRARA